MYLFMKASCVVLRSVRLHKERLTQQNSLGNKIYGRFTMLNIPQCEYFTLLVCLLWFLMNSAMRQLGNVQSFKTYMFRF